jgi:hypothetical protein
MRIGLGRGFFAIAAASLAILSLTYGEFGPSGRPLPGWIPWRETWVYLSALLLLAASAGLCFSRTALPGALTIGAYQAVWAVLGTPPILSKPMSIGAWYGFCEAMTPCCDGSREDRRYQSPASAPCAWHRFCLASHVSSTGHRTLSTPIIPPAWSLPGYPIGWDWLTSPGLATLLLELASLSAFSPVSRPPSKRS